MPKVTVTLAPDREAADVVKQLRSAGLEVSQVLEAIGVVTGSIPTERRSALEALEGVESVDEELTYRLAPPNSAIQ